MQDPFVGQITMYAFDFAPEGWAICNGASLSPQQNAALYSLIGNVYGGNHSAFNLPDLRGRTIIGSGMAATGTYYAPGTAGGANTFTVPAASLPQHNHTVKATTASPTQLSPAGGIYAKMPSNGNPPISGLYTTGATEQAAMAANAFATAGAGQPAENRQPSLALKFCIATIGLYPMRP